MQRFIHDKNLELYRRKLAESTNEEERKTLARLISEEESKKIEPKERK